MIFDLGIGQNLMQNKSGVKPSFSLSAWIVQVIAWFFTCFIAFPVSKIYQATQIIRQLLLTRLTVVIDRLSFTSIWVNRHMQLKKYMILDKVSQAIGLVTIILCAFEWESLWALLVAGLVSSPINGSSQIFFKGPKIRSCWDREARRELIHFGKWIFFSSLTNFLASRFDILLMGLYLSKRELGLYGIASAVVYIVVDGLASISIPLYSHLKRYTQAKMRSRVFLARIALLGLILPSLYLMSLYAQEVLSLIYPPAYYDAGWMLQILAIGGIFKSIKATVKPLFTHFLQHTCPLQ
ncbi:MAG TPA: oligosaccharide flippase family protein [Waddliaceae bacterium]